MKIERIPSRILGSLESLIPSRSKEELKCFSVEVISSQPKIIVLPSLTILIFSSNC
jgi:hypothetical protein